MVTEMDDDINVLLLEVKSCPPKVVRPHAGADLGIGQHSDTHYSDSRMVLISAVAD